MRNQEDEMLKKCLRQTMEQIQPDEETKKRMYLEIMRRASAADNAKTAAQKKRPWYMRWQTSTGICTAALLCDLIYNPWETKFLAYGRQRGLETMNGMAMLIYQGLLAFEIFMDVRLNYAEEYSRIYPLCRDRLIKK